ncbi:type IX secretion/gliding motility protein PorT/SprT [Flavobacterium difficile]|uniref:PorT family protein n=1 Tax=Flavobacterium difficile TaxID=2709659 RepID=A0ABX0I5F5_9FLAO|nr:porin family protein [Flavobacterium difficile]NHM00706.1 PorT family protein [Flavobacterium difficile]
MQFKSIFILLFITLNSFGQGGTFGKDPIIQQENFDKQRVHWGYFLGFSSYNYQFNYLTVGKDIELKTSTGFNVGLVGNLRLNEFLDLRFEPGFYATQRNLVYPDIANSVDKLREVKAANLHFPLLLKYSALRTGNVRPYLLGGVSSTLNLGSNEKAPDDNFSDRFRVKTWTQNYEIGFGLDLYLEYFKFSPSIRGVFGMNDELIRDNDPNSPWTGNIQSMKTRAVFINFTFH